MNREEVTTNTIRKGTKEVKKVGRQEKEDKKKKKAINVYNNLLRKAC